MKFTNHFKPINSSSRDVFALVVIISFILLFIYIFHYNPIFLIFGSIAFLFLVLFINYPFIALFIDLIFVFILMGVSSDIYSSWSYKLFSFVTILALFLNKTMHKEKFTYGSLPDILLLLGYVIFMIISSIINSVTIIIDILVVMLMKYMITFLMINIITTKKLLLMYLVGFLVIGTINNIVGILQVILNLDWYGFGPRAIGFLVNPNGIGYLEVTLIPIIFILLSYAKKRYHRVILIILFILCPLTAVLSQSRGGMIATFIVMSGIFLVFLRNYYAFFIIIIASILIALFWQEPYTARLRNTFEREELLEETRGFLYRAGFLMIIEHPIFGVGPGKFGEVFIKHYATRVNAPFRRWYVPHNGYIEIMTNAGIPGLIFIMSLIGLWISRLLKNAKLAKLQNDRSMEQTCHLMIVLIIGYLIVAAFETLIEVKIFYYIMSYNIIITRFVAQSEEAKKSHST